MFRNRKQAGFLLSKKLRTREVFSSVEDLPIAVFALSVSSLPIAAEIASSLNCSLKLLMPGAGISNDLRITCAILVDDGIDIDNVNFAILAAKDLRRLNPDKIIVAAPVMATDAYTQIRAYADDCVAILMPERKKGISEYFMSFEEISDFQIPTILNDCNGDQICSAWQ